MKMTDIAIVGAARRDCPQLSKLSSRGKVVLIDENLKPGGQLFKQIHKFLVRGSIKQVLGASRSLKTC